MWIKICGNTNLEDAKLAAELGADAVGFIFAASKRRMTAAQVAAIAGELPQNVERVGVFGSHDAEDTAFLAKDAQLNAVQLHGGFDEALLTALAPMLSASGIRIIQTLHWTAGGSEDPIAMVSELEEQMERVAARGIDRVLIDSKVGASPSGGTGVAFDWSAARSLFSSTPAGLRVIVAGGLTPDNVAQAIAELDPFGVDVSSGVEASVGRKDPARVAQFIKNARAAASPNAGVR
ncbi:MAG TPA: phosphoribosylanthranilate isomerase [Acidobacteriaceae bacterium]|nr:phosphoribosylanthranilate isomerase [Acidobacteriaceae bacterium]